MGPSVSSPETSPCSPSPSPASRWPRSGGAVPSRGRGVGRSLGVHDFILAPRVRGGILAWTPWGVCAEGGETWPTRRAPNLQQTETRRISGRRPADGRRDWVQGRGITKMQREEAAGEVRGLSPRPGLSSLTLFGLPWAPGSLLRAIVYFAAWAVPTLVSPPVHRNNKIRSIHLS